MTPMRTWTEENVPRRVMIENQVSSGSPGALLRRAP
jgi:hypothetical protein